MSAGSLRADIKLDEPGRIHYGARDCVTGNVVLSFRPNVMNRDQSSEFFGPLKISVTFHGRLKSKIRVKRGNSSSTYRGRIPIFSRTVTIFDNSAKIAVGEHWPVPFSVHFPTGFESKMGPGIGSSLFAPQDPRFCVAQDQPLPPSFVHNYSGFSNHYESFVEYRIGVSIHVPHLPVDIIQTDKETEPIIHYQFPRIQRGLEPEQKLYRTGNRVDISNEFLLPEDERPSGFRQRAKAALSSDIYPHYNFNWTLVVPRFVYLGQSIPFEIHVSPRENECTAPVIPDIWLKHFTASLTSHTVVRAEKQFISNPEAGHDDTVLSLKGEPDHKGPFGKSHDWTKTITTALVPDRLNPSFKTVNISHTHSLEIKILLQAASKNISFERNFHIDVLPPLLSQSTQSHEATVSSSAAAAALLGREGPPPPLAREAQRVEEALPRYEEGLPEYHEATGSRPAPPPKDELEGQGVVLAHNRT